LRKISLSVIGIAGTASVLAMFTLAPVIGAVKVDTSTLRDAVTLEGVRAHQAAFQAHADANGGTREASTPGYFASVDYVANAMGAAGYQVTVQEFQFPFFQELTAAELQQTAPTPTRAVQRSLL
jgi:hypothetical protein